MAKARRANQRQDASSCLGGICGVLSLYNLTDSHINAQGYEKGK